MDHPAPLISIITVNRNDAVGLRRTIDSVAGQTFRDFEHVVIDGASTDNSLAVIEQYAGHLSHWRSEPDSGIYNAMNKGVAMARGQYLLFLNSGDHLLDSGSLQVAAPRLRGEQLVYFALGQPQANTPGAHYWSVPEELGFRFFATSSLPHQSTFIKSELFSNFGHYDESLQIVADWKAFMLWVCKHNCSYRAVPEVLSVFYKGGLSSRPESAALIARERHTTLMQEFPAIYPDMLSLRKDAETLQNLRRNTLIRLLQQLHLMKRF